MKPGDSGSLETIAGFPLPPSLLGAQQFAIIDPRAKTW